MVENRRLKRNSCGRSYRDWRNVPADALGVISERLDLVDHIRFRVVCKSWNKAIADGFYLPKSPQEPWFFVALGDNDGDDTDLGFFDSTRKLYMNFEKPRGHQLGAKGGRWLVTLSPYFEETVIWNPINHEFHHFPSILTLPGAQDFFDRPRWLRERRSHNRYQLLGIAHKYFILNIKPFKSFNGDDGTSSMTAIIIYHPNNLAFARAGDAVWTPFHDGDVDASFELLFVDVVLYRGCIYAVRGDGVVKCWDTTMGLSPELSRTWPANPDFCTCSTYKKCFVTSGSKLLVVHSSTWAIDSITNEVLELDNETKEWRRIRSLCGGNIFIHDSYNGVHVENSRYQDQMFLTFLSGCSPFVTFIRLYDFAREKFITSLDEILNFSETLGWFVPAPTLKL